MLMWRTIRFGLAASVCAQFGQVNGGTHTTNRPEEIAKTYQMNKKATHFTLLLDPVFSGCETKACFLVPVERSDKDTLFAHHTRTHLARNTRDERQVESL